LTQKYNSLPTYETAFEVGGRTSKTWYFFLQALWNGIAPGGENSVTPTASPFVFTAPRRGFLIVQGGTVSFVSYSRDQVTFHNTGVVAGAIPASKGDLVSVTYSVAPTLTFVPQ
jgi:hypothetical protein